MADQGSSIHTPVLLAEVLSYLRPRPGGTYVDGTVGMGGHGEAILRASSPDGRLIGFDWDGEALAIARERLQGYGDRVTLLQRNFSELGEGLAEIGCPEIDGLLIDIGVSSLQLDRGGRGFSFRRDEPLDMRMDARKGLTAADILADCSEEELADILFYYGEEKQARRIAAEIVASRRDRRVETSAQLAALVAAAIPKRFHPKKIHVATRTFQALRMAVNTELENLSAIIAAAGEYLGEGARFCVISFHSLEDRIVKRRFRENRRFTVVTPRPVSASGEEVRGNPRSRSAKLRVAEKKN